MDKSNKVGALLSIRLWADCPHCNEQMDLMDNYANEEGSITKCIMNALSDSSAWKNVGMEVECEHCKKQFIFDSIEW